MKIAIIPARGGSKRIPKKNIKEFCGKPIIAYSIEEALRSALFDDVIVSTDDEAIARVARSYGASVPFLRPAELSTDTSGTGEVIDHALEFLRSQGKSVEFVCTIYATAPFLDKKYLKEGLERLKNSDARHAFSCTTMPYPIWRTFRITDEGRCEMFWRENFEKRSQDLVEAYHDAGQFYWSNLNVPKSDIMFSSCSIPIVLPRHLVQDIDTPEDWIRAEMMYEVIKREQNEANSI